MKDGLLDIMQPEYQKYPYTQTPLIILFSEINDLFVYTIPLNAHYSTLYMINLSNKLTINKQIITNCEFINKKRERQTPPPFDDYLE